MKWIALMVLAALTAACGGTTMPTVTSTPEPPSPPDGLPTMWSTTQSPLFPTEWPPTPSTVWVRYSFAYGRNPTTLMDGAYVTKPMTRTVIQRDGSDGESTTMSTALEEAGIQGVKPLDAASSTALGKELQVQAQCLQLQALPDEATAVELRAYYRVWVGLNGAFTALIRSDHAAFLDWIEAAP